MKFNVRWMTNIYNGGWCEDEETKHIITGATAEQLEAVINGIMSEEKWGALHDWIEITPEGLTNYVRYDKL